MLDNKILIGCDLNWNGLKMYTVPDWVQDDLEASFPNVLIEFINVGNTDIDEKYLPWCDIYWGNRINKDVVKMMIPGSLKWIHLGSSSYDKLSDIWDWVKFKKIKVTNSKGIMSKPVAAHAISMMFSLARGLHRNAESRGEYDLHFDQVHDVFEETLMIVGYGDIGGHIAKFCGELMNIIPIYKQTHISDYIDQADYVINTLPLTNETKGYFNWQIFSHMKGSAFFISVGHGQTVKQDHLFKALYDGEISGAAIDTYEQKIDIKTNKLNTLDNVILTPHVACVSQNYWEDEYRLFKDNLIAFLNQDSNLRNEIRL